MYVCTHTKTNTQAHRHTHLSQKEGMVDKEEDKPKGDAAHEPQPCQ